MVCVCNRSLNFSGGFGARPTFFDVSELVARVVEDDRHYLEVGWCIDLCHQFNLLILCDEVYHVVAEDLPLYGRELTSGKLFTKQE